MTRSPLFYPLGRPLDGDAGSVADLQTDVMRFMAILALCLVAIFALVQSIPLAPTDEMPEAVPATAAEPVPASEAESAPEPAPEPEPPAAHDVVLTRPQAAQAAPAEKPERDGFTLRFEDELALTRLVARNEVGLYAILRDRSYRMNVNRGQSSFWPASMPNRFHEMDETTVPDAVIDAFQRSGAEREEAFKWGVTIPPATSRQLEQYLREATGGALIIDAAGRLRLEP